LNPDIVPVIKKQMEKINQRVWKIRIRFQPALEIDEVEGFIKDDENTAQNRKRCLALSNRMNVQPSGEVTVCKLFPEFTVGSLKNEGVKELWHNEKFKRCPRNHRMRTYAGMLQMCSFIPPRNIAPLYMLRKGF
jgi:radical SAM protein with 4Fe4S-binding SPASM domain